MIRISASDLESLRFWQDRDDGSLEDLRRKLRHEEPPTPQMEAGRAFAKMWETMRPGAVEVAEVEGWTFDMGDLEAVFQLPPVRELKAEFVMDTPSGPVTLVGMCDGLDGTTVHDQKLTERWDAEKYLDSLQWRVYLFLFGCRKFQYDVFVGRYQGKTVKINEYHPLEFYRYPGLEDDVRAAVNELAEIISVHLPERVT
jgi:hypothetical protein